MNNDTDRHCNDLTQLCSREQLSALMDGALPEDQTRFLLRRLQHDAALAGCWERWRTAADAMRGVAPTRCLPADFASRVAAALQEDAPLNAAERAAARASQRRRWGGGAALAAALATLAVLGLPKGESAAPQAAADVVARQANPITPGPSPTHPNGAPAPQLPAASDALPPEALEAAASLVAVTSASRANRRKPLGEGAGSQAASVVSGHVDQAAPAEFVVAALPASDIVTRPWPRSVLPQYGNAGLTVGFGELPARAAETGTLRASSTFARPPGLLKTPKPASGTDAEPTDPAQSASGEMGKEAVPVDVQPDIQP